MGQEALDRRLQPALRIRIGLCVKLSRIGMQFHNWMYDSEDSR